MDEQDLITILENRISYHEQQRVSAAQRGDVAMVQFYESDIAKTTGLVNRLRSLVGTQA